MATRAQRRAAAKAAQDAQTVENKLTDAQQFARDGFVNYAARLGAGPDGDNLNTFASYTINPITRNRQLMDSMYRGSWIIGAAVDCVADDMTRAGIDLASDVDPDDSETLQTAFQTMQIWTQLGDALRWARLYGGCIAVYMIDGQDVETPLDMEKVGKGQFKGLHVIDRWQLQPTMGEVVEDFGPEYGKPEFYKVVADQSVMAGFRSPMMGKRIHYSRIIRFEGPKLPFYQRMAEYGWGMSMLERLWDRLVAFDSATNGGAQLLHKAHYRTIKIEGLRQIIAGGGAALDVVAQELAQIRKFQSIEGLTVIDAKDELETQTYTFAGLPEIIMQFGQQISGAIQVPLVRLFGQSPAGLNSTGESDWRMYYDGINKDQERDLRVPIKKICELTSRSELNKELDEGFNFGFSPLWNKTDKEKAEIAAQVTTAVTTAMRDAVIDHATALKELRKSSQITGIFTSITDEDIEEAEQEPPNLGEMEFGPDQMQQLQEHPQIAPKFKAHMKAEEQKKQKAFGKPKAGANGKNVGKDASLLDAIAYMEDRGFNPAEPRVPEGHVGGGQWTRGTSVAKLKGLQGRLQTEGGFTYQVLHGTSPKPGEHAMILSPYQAREQKIALADLKPTDLARYVVKNIDKLRQPDHFLGAWHNPEDGLVYLDVSIAVHGHKAAEALCREHKQLAYFDLDHMQTVYMPKETKNEAASAIHAH